MLICVSLNPAVDKRLRLERLRVGNVNRAYEASPAPGGKAARVAMVLRTLGTDPLRLGFAGSATGKQLIEGLHGLSIRAQDIPTSGCTRANLEIVEDEEGVTDILEPGQRIATQELRQFEETLTNLLSGASEAANGDFFREPSGRECHPIFARRSSNWPMSLAAACLWMQAVTRSNSRGVFGVAHKGRLEAFHMLNEERRREILELCHLNNA